MASQKISQFTAITTLASGDYFPVIEASGTTNKRVEVGVLDVRYTASASGDAAQSTANTALASGNAALTDLSGKYDKTGGAITGFVATESQVVGAITGPVLVSGGIQLNFAATNNWDLVLADSTELLNPANVSGGQCGVITVRQSTAGSGTLSYSGYWNFPAGTAPTLTTTASGVDILAYYCSSPTEIQVVYNLDFS